MAQQPWSARASS